MLSPLIRRARKNGESDAHSNQRGVTIALVAISMVVIIGMAALSIDVGTLYQAKAEAQRAADAAALAAARVISTSGITGDPNNSSGQWQAICGAAGTATLAATSVAQTPGNLIGRVPASTVQVRYGTGGTAPDCSTLAGPGLAFSVNPTVTVKVQQANLPTFFARVFSLLAGGTSSNSGVSATATAEVYNPSGSGALGSGIVVPVQPRCVKPWIIPNVDPQHGGATFVSTAGAITNPGVFGSNNGVIDETFSIIADCVPGAPNCQGGNMLNNPPIINSGPVADRPDVEYLPALVQNPSSAVPVGATTNNYQEAIAGCDQTTVYACGTPIAGQMDLTENPVNPAGAGGDTPTGVAYLTNLTLGGGAGGLADTLVAATYPFQIQAGSSNPLVAQGIIASNSLITTSNAIVTVPIYDNAAATPLAPPYPQVTILGFLQVFINQVNADGSLNVTVMNVSGCSNTAAAAAVAGTSPVPVRLITPP
jgi:Flp pilus assembly protein TadG